MGIHPNQFGPGAHLVWLFLAMLCVSPGNPAYAGSDVEITIEPGRWGGPGAALTVVENGATVEFDCAMGYIREPIIIKSNGRFSVPGVFIPDAGGPVRISDPKPKGSPAVFSGEVSNSNLLLQVDMPDGGRTIGPFKLTRSQPASLNKCL